MDDLLVLVKGKSASDPQLRAVRKKVRKGTADFNDTAQYSEALSKLIGKNLSANILDIPPDVREKLSTELLEYGYTDINELLNDVQISLDEKNGIHIRPQRADFPTERVEQFVHSLIDPTVDDSTIKRRARAGSETITKSFHDDYMKKNAAFRSDAGLKCYIVRTAAYKCCEWCSNIAGRYPYNVDEMPEDVFRRHDNCDCRTILENGRERQDVWSKRSWEVPETGPGAESPAVFTEEQAKAIEQRNLQQFRGVKINNSSIDNSGGSGIIESRNITSRNLPNGLRTAPSHILTEAEIESLKKDIASIEADESVFRFNKGHRTGYDDVLDEIRVKGDILPDLSSKHPRDRMSSRAALAHEYYGHRANRGTNVPNGAWNDEFRASYMAAKNCPNLSDEERADLILDALERAKESGVTIKNNSFIRRVLYGY